MERNLQQKYDTNEALQLIIEPGEESELSDLEESDAEDYEIPDNILDGQLSMDEDENEENNEEQQPQSQVDKGTVTQNRSNGAKKTEHVFKWRSRRNSEPDTMFTGNHFSPPPDDADTMSPLQYFKLFWGDALMTLLAEQTNLYSVQKTGQSIATTKQEIEKFIGIEIHMSIVRMPSYTMYWAAETRYPCIADVMPINRYKKLRQFLHVSDNTLAENDVNKGNRLYKIQPVLDHVRNNCLKVDPEVENSIDEQIIPAKTRYSGIRQYNPRKPVKWGFKNFVPAGKSGMMYHFFMYTGASTSSEKCTGEYVVLRLCETLPNHQNYKLFFDNWFSTLLLLIKLKEKRFLATATIRADRLKGCPLPKDKELVKQGRGSTAFKCDANSGLTILKWHDNKCVQVCSNHSDPSAMSTIKRWDKVRKKHVNIKCPNTIKEYNESMGGVDLADMLISVYRTHFKTKRWYLKILFHCIDISKVNAWLLYRCHANQMNVPERQHVSLLKFISAIADGLVRGGKVKNDVGRPRKRRATDTPPVPRKQPAAVPCDDVPCDSVGHWAEYQKKKNKCRQCKVNYSRVYCKKCNLCLCMNNTRNCFYDFHTVK